MRRSLPAAVTIAWLAQLSPVSAQAPDTAAAGLVRLWGTELSLGPAVRGLLTVRRTPTGWSAEVGNLEADAAASGNSVRVTLPDAQGEFRGRVRADGAAIDGYWVQAPGVVTGVPYASPCRLVRVAEGVWQGTLQPLDDRYTLYLAIGRDSAGGLSGSFRNPDRNDRGGASRFAIERRGDTLDFRSGPGTSALTAVYDSAQQQIVVPWAPLGVTLTLQPRTPESAGWYPRAPWARPYAYRAPLPASDGWAVARASTVGVAESLLTRLVREIAAADPAQSTAQLIHSVLIARHGKLVLDEYFFGYDRELPHDTRSASKTFASVMVGAAAARGLPLDPDRPIAPYFARYRPFDHADPRKDGITLRHLMTMTSGLACDENDSDSPGNEGTMQTQTAQPDWYRFTLDLPMAHEPGAVYAYCSAGANLIGGVVAAATRSWLPALFDTLVARPLGMRRYYVNLTPTGDMYFGGGVRLRPRDFLKLGQVYLDGGTWHGRRIVTSDWVRRSTAPAADTSAGRVDGFNWHLHELQAGGRSYREYEANGNGGQFLIVLPQLDLAVVFTAGNYGSYGVWRKFRDDLVPRLVIPAVAPAVGLPPEPHRPSR